MTRHTVIGAKTSRKPMMAGVPKRSRYPGSPNSDVGNLSAIWQEGSGPSAGGFISSEFLENYVEVVNSLGGDAGRYLREVGINPASLVREGEKLSAKAVALLLQRTASELECQEFGMRLAEGRSGRDTMKPLNRIVMTAPTLGDTFRWTTSHMESYCSALAQTVVRHPELPLTGLRFSLPVDGLPVFRQMTEAMLLMSRNIVPELTGGKAKVREVWFTHSPISPIATYRQKFGTSLKFGQEFNAYFVNDNDLSQPMIENDSRRYRTEANWLESHFQPSSLPFSIQVREALRILLPSGTISRAAVAEALGMSIRTLHRRLHAAGQSFEGIRDQVRRNLAIQYLATPDVPLTEVSAKLGYAEPTVLWRSCRRWFAASPSALREELIRTMAR